MSTIAQTTFMGQTGPEDVPTFHFTSQKQSQMVTGQANIVAGPYDAAPESVLDVPTSQEFWTIFDQIGLVSLSQREQGNLMSANTCSSQSNETSSQFGIRHTRIIPRSLHSKTTEDGCQKNEDFLDQQLARMQANASLSRYLSKVAVPHDSQVKSQQQMNMRTIAAD